MSQHAGSICHARTTLFPTGHRAGPVGSRLCNAQCVGASSTLTALSGRFATTGKLPTCGSILPAKPTRSRPQESRSTRRQRPGAPFRTNRDPPGASHLANCEHSSSNPSSRAPFRGLIDRQSTSILRVRRSRVLHDLSQNFSVWMCCNFQKPPRGRYVESTGAPSHSTTPNRLLMNCICRRTSEPLPRVAAAGDPDGDPFRFSGGAAGHGSQRRRNRFSG